MSHLPKTPNYFLGMVKGCLKALPIANCRQNQPGYVPTDIMGSTVEQLAR